MEKVNGIGGLFFRAKDPDGLAQWYFTHLVFRWSPRTITNCPGGRKPGHRESAPFLRQRSTLAIPRKRGWSIFGYSALTPWLRNCAPQAFPLRWTSNPTRTAALPACVILRAIRLSCGGPTGRYARRWATRADPDGYRIESASPTDAPEEAELQE